MTHHRIPAPVAPRSTSNTVLRPLGIDAVAITDGEWARWQADNRETTTPHIFGWLERDGTVDNLRRLDPERGLETERRGLWFSDSDLYKAIEGVAWELARQPSDELRGLLDEMAAVIDGAQEADGYLNSFVQAGLDVRWDNLVKSHELYCIGHLIQAAIADARSSGHRELLDIAIRAADLVVADFGDGRRKDFDGHEEIEMALVELYRETGNESYLSLAQQFIDGRGYEVLPSDGRFDSEYFQDSVPVREGTTVFGHAVRAIYLLAGVADLYLETGERALLDSTIRQWESMVTEKSYVTGAFGSRFAGEAFGDAFELPPDLAYGETCATIGNIMLSWRLLLATGEARFADEIERGLYNLFAASTAVPRNGFFYNNPVQRRRALPAAPTDARPTRADAPGTRPLWFECACCPPNVLRMVASLSAYLATTNEAGIQVHQFMPGTVTAAIGEGTVTINTTTRYPIDGVIGIQIEETPPEEWTLSLRIPHWANVFNVSVNGEDLLVERGPSGYGELAREWRAGDQVVLTLPVEPRLSVAHPAIDALRGTVAVERGPVVYALESTDQAEGVDLDRVELYSDQPLRSEIVELFGHPAVVIEANGIIRDDSAWRASGYALLGEEPSSAVTAVPLRFIPYALWANRGPSTMRVHLPHRRSQAL